ncbi:isomerase motif protein [Ranid herpesvirus 3]|uniref:Isomerase motif protein n=1 Tax=Ranid herpesvirus 3 TaxID=1987509 RepID=A0A1X9T517_9VIRU|nr:isomerase motif protein [Ranid herpesvirus 3]ARR28808.1 isomerase motif protein [Ranid herpesvirus 3]
MYRNLLKDFTGPRQTALAVQCHYRPAKIPSVESVKAPATSYARLLILKPHQAQNLAYLVLNKKSLREVLPYQRHEGKMPILISTLGIYIREINILRIVYLTDDGFYNELTSNGYEGLIYTRVAAHNFPDYMNGDITNTTPWVALLDKEEKQIRNTKTKDLICELLKITLNHQTYHPFAAVETPPHLKTSIGQMADQVIDTFNRSNNINDLNRLKNYVSTFNGAFFQVFKAEPRYDCFLHILCKHSINFLLNRRKITDLDIYPNRTAVFVGVMVLSKKVCPGYTYRLVCMESNGVILTCDTTTMSYTNTYMHIDEFKNSSLKTLIELESLQRHSRRTSQLQRKSLEMCFHVAILQTMCTVYENGGWMDSPNFLHNHLYNPYLSENPKLFICAKPLKHIVSHISFGLKLKEFPQYCEDPKEFLENSCNLTNRIENELKDNFNHRLISINQMSHDCNDDQLKSIIWTPTTLEDFDDYSDEDISDEESDEEDSDWNTETDYGQTDSDPDEVSDGAFSRPTTPEIAAIFRDDSAPVDQLPPTSPTSQQQNKTSSPAPRHHAKSYRTSKYLKPYPGSRPPRRNKQSKDQK